MPRSQMSWKKNPGKVRVRTYDPKSPGRSEALRFINSAKYPSTKISNLLCLLESLRLKFTNEPSFFFFCRWVFGWVDKAQSFWSARPFGAIGSSPDFSRVFSRHLASGHLNLSRCSPQKRYDRNHAHGQVALGPNKYNRLFPGLINRWHITP